MTGEGRSSFVELDCGRRRYLHAVFCVLARPGIASAFCRFRYPRFFAKREGKTVVIKVECTCYDLYMNYVRTFFRFCLCVFVFFECLIGPCPFYAVITPVPAPQRRQGITEDASFSSIKIDFSRYRPIHTLGSEYSLKAFCRGHH